jgi:hypothetical protein
MDEVHVPVRVDAKLHANLADATGLVGKIVDSIRNACGLAYEPIAVVRKAKADAHAKLIATQNQIEVAELLHKAGERFLSQQLRQQNNIDAIVAKAIQQADSEEGTGEACDPDWINEFIDCSKNISNEQMQDLLAKILAGEVSKPGRFSRRTVNLVRTISRSELEQFISLCGFAWKVDTDSIVIPDTEFGWEREVHSPAYDAILLCRSIGLIYDRSSFSIPGGTTINFDGRVHTVETGKELSLEVSSLTPVGKELIQVVAVTASDDWYRFWLSRWNHALVAHDDVAPALPGAPTAGVTTLSTGQIKDLVTQTVKCINYWWERVEPYVDDLESPIFPDYSWKQFRRAFDRYKPLREELVRRDPALAADMPDFDQGDE